MMVMIITPKSSVQLTECKIEACQQNANLIKQNLGAQFVENPERNFILKSQFLSSELTVQ